MAEVNHGQCCDVLIKKTRTRIVSRMSQPVGRRYDVGQLSANSASRILPFWWDGCETGTGEPPPSRMSSAGAVVGGAMVPIAVRVRFYFFVPLRSVRRTGRITSTTTRIYALGG
jgi:hypothetical protein